MGDSRGADTNNDISQLKLNVIPIPLLYRSDKQHPLIPAAERQRSARSVLFSGACSNPVRCLFGNNSIVPPSKDPTSRYAWNMYNCGEKTTQENFNDELREATWMIVPGGRM